MKWCLFTFMLLFVFGLEATGEVIDYCGTYKVEGFLKEIDEKQKLAHFVTDKGSDSQFIFMLSYKGNILQKRYVGSNLSLSILLPSSCSFQCKGELLQVNAVLKPYQKPKAFLYPKPRPVKKVVCKN